MINDSMTQCRFCNTPVDPGAAQMIADRKAKANQAYSDAGYLRTAVIAMYVVMALKFIQSVVPLVGFWVVITSAVVVNGAWWITFVLVLVLLIRWQVKFGRLTTNDADYLSARRSWRLSLVLWLVAIPLEVSVWLVYFLFEAAVTR